MKQSYMQIVLVSSQATNIELQDMVKGETGLKRLPYCGITSKGNVYLYTRQLLLVMSSYRSRQTHLQSVDTNVLRLSITTTMRGI